jgi:hypothetical protein
MPSGSSYKYGSVPEDQEGADTSVDENNFKETDLLYYKGRTLSQKEKTVKIIKIALPVLVAVLLIGTLAWFLLSDFGHLYPGPSGVKPPDQSSSTISYPASTPHLPSGPEPASAPAKLPVRSSSTSPLSSGGGSSCAAHSNCNKLGLTGECCPTAAGDMLDCCS